MSIKTMRHEKMEKKNNMGEELKSEQREAVSGGAGGDSASPNFSGKGVIVRKKAQGARPAAVEALPDPLNPNDPNWTEIDYKCPRCGASIYQWICPGTQSQLYCRNCSWQKWF